MLTEPEPGNPHYAINPNVCCHMKVMGVMKVGAFNISCMFNAAYLLYSGGFSRNVSLHHWHSKYLLA